MAVAVPAVVFGCKAKRSATAVVKSSAATRADRRAYDGAPPVIPHAGLGMRCVECHNRMGRQVENLGFAPASPHEKTPGLSMYSNCRQCHVERTTRAVFVANSFEGIPQDLRQGRRALGAPPVMPHPKFMRDNCQACHTGPAARTSIRTSHPERVRCLQCHVEQKVNSLFVRDG